jgi:hypothetical protein
MPATALRDAGEENDGGPGPVAAPGPEDRGRDAGESRVLDPQLSRDESKRRTEERRV